MVEHLDANLKPTGESSSLGSGDVKIHIDQPDAARDARPKGTPADPRVGALKKLGPPSRRVGLYRPLRSLNGDELKFIQYSYDAV